MMDRFDGGHVEREGYTTDGTETITLRPVQAKQASRILAGYELQWDGTPVAYIDILNGDVRISNSLPSFRMLILSSIATAALVRRMQHVQGD